MFRIVAAGVREALDRVSAEISATARQAIGQAALYAAELAKRTTTFKDRTGEARRKINRQAKGPYSVFVKADARHSLFLEDGTTAHTIKSKPGGPRLRYVQGGTTFFRSSVRHPGTKATHFMRDARDEAERDLGLRIEVGIRHVVSG